MATDMEKKSGDRCISSGQKRKKKYFRTSAIHARYVKKLWRCRNRGSALKVLKECKVAEFKSIFFKQIQNETKNLKEECKVAA